MKYYMACPKLYTKQFQRKIIVRTICLWITNRLNIFKKLVHNKDVSTDKYWAFELGVAKRLDVLFNFIVGFMQRAQIHQKGQNNDTIYQLSQKLNVL